MNNIKRGGYSEKENKVYKEIKKIIMQSLENKIEILS